tara:strand:- start:1821 stop:2114 length:294 start_codon:yes stop_codon:yes gene_type:complete
MIYGRIIERINRGKNLSGLPRVTNPHGSGKDMRKVICLTTDGQDSGIPLGDTAEVHIIVDIDMETADMAVVTRLGVAELTDDGKQKQLDRLPFQTKA